MKLKKIPYYLTLLLLAAGASLIIGLLSFSGMFALLPVLGLASAAFGLSVIYEGQIYMQNISSAFKKIFNPNHLKRHLAKDYLQNRFPEASEFNRPQFFKDYDHELALLEAFEHSALDEASQARKEQIEKTLADMEKWFTKQLFTSKRTPSTFEKTKLAKRELHVVNELGKIPSLNYVQYKNCFVYCKTKNKFFIFKKDKQIILKEEESLTQNLRALLYEKDLHDWLEKDKAYYQNKEKLIKRRGRLAGIFGSIAGLFMGVGTTYLLVEAFTIIPFLAVLPFAIWPALIVPMAVIAGVAYGTLTYNAIDDMIKNDTLRTWYNKLRNDLKKGFTFRNVFMVLTATTLFALAIALTICTAGTWWTVVKNTRPIFSWMSKIPGFIMQVINPIIIGISTIFFNLENTFETLEIVYKTKQSNSFYNFLKNIGPAIQNVFKNLHEKENIWQILNPFRIFIKLTYTPLRVILFLGHLISIGVTSDRLPGIPEIISALLGIISEGFEDAHYFFHGAHECGNAKQRRDAHLTEGGHSHEDDIPSQVLSAIFYPIHWAAAAWDFKASQLNKETTKPVLTSMKNAFNKQKGLATVEINEKQTGPSLDWKKQHILLQLDERREQLDAAQFNPTLAKAKAAAITQFRDEIQASPLKNFKEQLAQEKAKPIYNQHRLSTFFSINTETTDHFDALYARTNSFGRPASPTSITEIEQPFCADNCGDPLKHMTYCQ